MNLDFHISVVFFCLCSRAPSIKTTSEDEDLFFNSMTRREVIFRSLGSRLWKYLSPLNFGMMESDSCGFQEKIGDF